LGRGHRLQRDPSLYQLGGPGERCKLSQWGPGRSSGKFELCVYVKHQWCGCKFILRGRNFFPHREGDGRTRGQKGRELGWGSWRGGIDYSETPLYQLGGPGERCKLPQRWSPGKFEIWCNLRPQNSPQKCLITCKLLQKG